MCVAYKSVLIRKTAQPKVHTKGLATYLRFSLQLCSTHREPVYLSFPVVVGQGHLHICAGKESSLESVAALHDFAKMVRFSDFLYFLKSTNLCKAHSRAPEEIFRICFFLQSGHDPLFSEKLVSDHIDLKFHTSVKNSTVLKTTISI